MSKVILEAILEYFHSQNDIEYTDVNEQILRIITGNGVPLYDMSDRTLRRHHLTMLEIENQHDESDGLSQNERDRRGPQVVFDSIEHCELLEPLIDSKKHISSMVSLNFVYSSS